MPERENEGLKLLGAEKTLHPYLIARLIELEALFDYLLSSGEISSENLQRGPILDLGTGAGPGLLALRRKSLAPIIGIDNAQEVPSTGAAGIFGWAVDKYAGSGLKVPEDKVLQISATTFQKEDITTFLSRRPYNTYSLITHLYTGDSFRFNRDYFNQVGLILAPGGQLLITSDTTLSWPSNVYPAWGTQKIDVIPYNHDSERYPSRKLKAPTDLITQLGDLGKDCVRYLEKDTTGEQVVNFRDRNFWIFTKKISL